MDLRPASFIWLSLAVIVALVLVQRLRMRQVAAAVRARLEERLVERERIARELHDTLLQGLQGLMLSFQAIYARIPKHEPAHDMMARTLTRADEVLIESRNRAKDLRDTTATQLDLAAVLAATGAQLAQQHSIEFTVAVEGMPRGLHPIFREEALMIGREALLDAFQHSAARKVEVEVSFGSAALRLCVRDDGRGVELPGGVRECARQIGSQLEIWSRPDAGTEVALSAPAAIAYRNSTIGDQA